MKLSMIILVFGTILPASALTLTVEYVDGKVEHRSASAWHLVREGDAIDDSASIRISRGGSVELDADGVKISVIEAGTYSIANIVSSHREVSSWDLAGIVGKKIAHTFDRKKTGTVSSTLGVRGDEIDDDDVEWMYSENAQDSIETAKTYIDLGNYESAVSLLLDYANSAPENELSAINFYIAYAYSLLDKKSLALNFINRTAPGPDEPLYPEYVLLKGRLLIECMSYEKALALFNGYLDELPDGQITQTVLILESFCYKGIGKPDKQKECLVRARDLGPDSDEGKRAKELLRSTAN